ncbi:MAG: hypothetical protein E6940_01370 [Clostridium septicum]|uniref:hypothetical protein n=1 Tax=Clostridium septicum TaxID=1504 RepID=UPI00258E3332|nr:hypothetical protein [Clostridium septicum]MDU1312699.1 hypothetical protein [Clostridium septicum]
MRKKGIVIYLLIVSIIIGVILNFCENNKIKSAEILGANDKVYYGIDKNENNFTGDFKKLNLVTYDKVTKKEEKYQLDFSENQYPIDISVTKAFNNWILTQTIAKEEIIGINISTREVKVLVRVDTKGKVSHSIKDFEIQGENLIYSYFNDGESKVEIKNLKTNKVLQIGKFKTIEKIPVTIFKDKAAYIVNNKIYIIDINNGQVINESQSLYKEELLMYEDKIYTFKLNGGYDDFIQIDLKDNLKEKQILERCSTITDLYESGGKIVYNNYFYDTNEECLYLRALENTGYIKGRMIIDNYILDMSEEYSEIEEGKNCFKYLLRGDQNRSIRVSLDDKRFIQVLVNGEVVERDSESNKILKHFSGFNIRNLKVVMDYAKSDNKLYGIEEVETGFNALVGLDLETGEKTFVKEVKEDPKLVRQIAVNNDEIGYLLQDESESRFVIYNMKTKNNEIINLDIQGYTNDIAFNDENILILQYRVPKIYSFDRKIGNITKESLAEYQSFTGVKDVGVISSKLDGEYELVDYKLNILRKFHNERSALKYIYKS